MSLTSKTKSVILTVLAWSLGVVFLAILCVEGWEFTNSNTFCARACHNVHPEETYAHQASQHSQVSCVECHMGRISTLEMMAVKVTHTKHLWHLLVGYERPLMSPSMPPSSDSCEGCHSDQPHRHDSILVRKHYDTDEKNSETTVQLTLRATGAYTREIGGEGINWHIEEANKVHFITTDEQKLNIPWVELTKPDGTTVVYRDITQPLTDETINVSEKKLMDCVDCHNRVGHRFINPETIADNALAQGDLNKELPFIKARLMALLEQDYTTLEEAMDLVEVAYNKYLEDFPAVAQEKQSDIKMLKQYLDERHKAIAIWMIRSKFRHPGVSWQSFQDQSGHRYTPGCFRCHNGKHRDQEGNPIPLNCTTCHDVPIVWKELQDTPARHRTIVRNYKPLSHQKLNFIIDHRKMENQGCSNCHGKFEHGTDDKSFCANSACHAVAWPGLDLNAGK